MTSTEIKKCRICKSTELSSVLDLGPQFISSYFPKGEIPNPLQQRYPLELVRCSAKNGCGLVQLRHSVSPALLYSDYGYRSGINQSMRDHLKRIAQKAETLAPLKAGDLVLDIGCNDGTLLEAYQTPGLERAGFDPADNIVAEAQRKGLHVINDYFSARTSLRAFVGRKARVITSIAMFYDLEDPRQFAHDIHEVLSDDGVWILEQSYLPFMLQNNSFDTICHEHLEYYSLKQIEWMIEKEGLRVQKVEFNDINGGSFRLFIRHATFTDISEKDCLALEKIRLDEEKLGLTTDQPYQQFREAVLKIRDQLKKLLVELKQSGKSVYVYGASTKGNTILQFCGIDSSLVSKAADRDPYKWGKQTLGSGIPIVSEEEARADRPDYFLILPWHFLSDFVTRESVFLEQGGRFIVPLPSLRIVGKGH